MGAYGYFWVQLKILPPRSERVVTTIFNVSWTVSRLVPVTSMRIFLVSVVTFPRSVELIIGGKESILSFLSMSNGQLSCFEMVCPYSIPLGCDWTIWRSVIDVSDPNGMKLVSSGLLTVYLIGGLIRSAW